MGARDIRQMGVVMCAQRRALIPILVFGLLFVAACGGKATQAPSASSADSFCTHLTELTQTIEGIRASAGNGSGGLQEQVGTSDSSTQLAQLADLKLAFDGDAQAYTDAGQAELADKVSALSSQIDMVVQRNTLEGVGTNDSGTDPTVNIEKRAADAGAVAGCTSP